MVYLGAYQVVNRRKKKEKKIQVLAALSPSEVFVKRHGFILVEGKGVDLAHSGR